MEGQKMYTFDETIKNQLATIALPIQGKRLNAARAMETVRQLLAQHPRYMRCGADYPGTEKEQLTIYFDFPDAVLKQERQQIAEAIQQQTGWPVVFSPSVRHDLLQAALVKIIGHATQSPSIHLHERKIAVAIDGSTVDEALITQFKHMTGFDVEWKGGNGTSSPALAAQAVFQAHTASKRMENNQAIDEAKRWATERGITMYKASIKQHGHMTVMEVHFVSPEIAKQHEVDLTELSYRIGFPVTYAKAPKQNEIIRLTLEALPTSWHVKKNPSLHIEKAVVALKLHELPAQDDIQAVQSTIYEATGYTLAVQV